MLEIHSGLNSTTYAEDWTEAVRFDEQMKQYLEGLNSVYYKQIIKAKSILVQLINHLLCKIHIRADCPSETEGMGACPSMRSAECWEAPTTGSQSLILFF